MARRTEKYTLLISHTSRAVNLKECAIDVLRARYNRPDRLADIPPQESLESLGSHRHYNGFLSVWDLTLGRKNADMELRQIIDIGYKVQNACFMADGRLVICGEDFILVWDGPLDELTPEAAVPGSPHRIEDGWFAGLHTALPAGSSEIVISASSPDGILRANIDDMQVIWRMPVPRHLYGRNYDPEDSLSFSQHYVNNDLQIAHVNYAWATENNEILMSSLIPGDIAKFDQWNNYITLKRGEIGCHGVAALAGSDLIYYSDTCRGDLVFLEPDGVERDRFHVDSQWLHDVKHVRDDLFVFCRSDRNLISLVDVKTGTTLIEKEATEAGGSTQFVFVSGPNAN